MLSQDQVRTLKAVAGRPSTWSSPVIEELVVKPWSRYGRKRTYVNDLQGKTLGYRDELTGQVVVDDPKEGRVRGALEEHRSRP